MSKPTGSTGEAEPEKKSDRLARLEEQMAVVLGQLKALGVPEVAAGPSAPAAAPAEPSAPQARAAGEEEAGTQGEFFFLGSIQLGGQPLKLLLRGNLSEALEDEAEVVAHVFAALGSPFRVRLLRALLDGPRTSQQLQTELAVGPVGQLYHHLKELLAARLIVQRRRSLYAIREEIVIPICLAFAVAPRLASSQGTAPQAEASESPGAAEPARRSET
jgi:ArsR family transcriptional regulator, arsenate/arsenite/antimonite-responsive transcriptional repressor